MIRICTAGYNFDGRYSRRDVRMQIEKWIIESAEDEVEGFIIS